MKHDLIIVGGGAAGIMAAICAKDRGADVAIIEGTDRVGKKILTTGNGRCNITNKFIEPFRYHSSNSDFFCDTLNNFSSEDTVNFFSSLGLPLVTLEEGKMYPMSLQASSVLDLMRFALEEKSIPVYLNSKVKEISPSKKGFKIICGNAAEYFCHKLILCCGGKSAANTGSDGTGFSIAKKLGHNIITPIPALVQLKLDYKNLKALAGVKFNGIAEVIINEKVKRKEFGEILFTDYGISGPPILQLSRISSSAVSKKESVVIRVNMIYNMSSEELQSFFEGHFGLFSYRSIHDSLIGIVNKKMIPIILKEAGITDIHKPCFNLLWKEKLALYKLLQAWEFKVTDTNSFSNAQVTAGGVDTKEIDPLTLESKLVPNLYFAGEIMDVDGDCGGFNLQWAWASAFAASSNACK